MLDLVFQWAFNQVLLPSALSRLQVALNKMGTNAVATQAIVSKIDQFAMLPMISIGLAMATFGAQTLWG